MSTTSDRLDVRRAAIERELAERLARDRDASASITLGVVRVMCLSCRAVTGADAQFCTRCGQRFNSLVVLPGGLKPSGDRP